MPTQNIFDLLDTWASGGGPYTSIKMNATDNDSGSASLLMDLQVGTVSKFKVTKTNIIVPVVANFTQASIGSTASSNSGFYTADGYDWGYTRAGSAMWQSGYDYFRLSTTANLGWGTGVTNANDTILTRRAAANLRLGSADAASGVQAQTLSVQSITGTNASAAAYPFKITGAQGTGTGAGGSIIFQVAPLGLTGAAQNTLVDALTIGSDRVVTVAANASSLAQIAMADRGTVISAYATAFGTQPLLVAMPGGIQINNDTGGFWLGAAADVRLYRDAANTLALRNGTAAQAFRVYNTTDGTNSEFGSIKWNSNVLEIAADIAGSGTRRPLAMVAGVGPYTVLKTTDYGTYLRQIATSSGLNLYNSDANALAAGSTGRVAYLEGASGICLSSSFEIKFSSGADAASSHDSGIARSAAGVLRLTNASTGGGALQLTEMTTPAAPATDNVRIYAEDNGSGKTRIMARFATGAAVQIAIEP